jgi:hypothetical protein
VPLRLAAGAVGAKVLLAVPDSPVPEQADVRCHVRGEYQIHYNIPITCFQGLLRPVTANLLQKVSFFAV